MGKGGEREVDLDKKLEVLIDGRYYDVTNLKHPGGSVIKFYAGKGIDASEAFANFHVRSKKAQKYMAALPSREANMKEERAKHLPGQEALLKDFAKLTNDLKAEGFFDPNPMHALYRVFEIVAMHAIGAYLLLNGHYYVGVTVLGIVSGRCGWLMHECGHYSLTGNIPLDRQLQVWLYGVGCGMSASWWRSQHNKHHSMPQKISHDVDLNTLPLVAFTDKVVKKAGKAMKSWLSLQATAFPLITCLLVALGWQLYLHPRHIVRTRQVSEGLALLTRAGIFWGLVVPYFGIWGGVKLYLLYNWIAADYIFINFAVSHTHLPTVPKEDTQVDWVRYAAVHTMNVASGPLGWVDWWMSYLNFQIEHHLFPSMPQYRHPIISPRVRALFEKHGLVYDQRSYTEAMMVTFKNLHKVGSDVFYG
eukprot:CAMPEP_0185029754 /NCGR_PEP_ID=MMETSP1103-20130426/16250_1 /TAXON_ID=36769 /ORGANISM="Paraphysomonas bandaiensis, Strain Caron Lab Isolate" /LENGTH=417 /DNA_ID=CAMNT_0027564609 /DNA_START=35 /DNA_END=1288 /DNA_ORIENTATION=-